MHNIKHLIIYIVAALALTFQASAAAGPASAIASGKEKVTFAYDLDFEMNFDNREFYKSNFSESMTIFGARLTPSVGVDVR